MLKRRVSSQILEVENQGIDSTVPALFMIQSRLDSPHFWH